MKLPKPLDIMIPFDGQLRIVRDKVNEIIYFLSTQDEKEEYHKQFTQGVMALKEMYEEKEELKEVDVGRGYYKGKPVEEMTKDELIDALEHVGRLYQQALKQ